VAAVPIEVAQTKTRIKKSLMEEVNLEFMAPMLFSGLVFGQPGVHWHSGLPWWVVMLPEDLASASRREELETFLAIHD
jgi:hypothetical protein